MSRLGRVEGVGGMPSTLAAGRALRLTQLGERLSSTLPALHECVSCTKASTSSSSCSGSSRREGRLRLLEELAGREVGGRRRIGWDWRRMSLCVFANKDREFVKEAEVEVRGRTKITDDKIYSTSATIDFNFTQLREYEVGETEGVEVRVDAMSAVTESGAPPRTPSYIVTLTNLGELRFFDPSLPTVRCVKKIVLPMHLFKFRRMEWSIPAMELTVCGVSQMPHIDEQADGEFVRGRQRHFQSSYGLCVVEVWPTIRVRCLLRLSPEHFGVLTGVCLRDESLVCMSAQRTTIYDFAHLYNQYCTHVNAPEDYGSLEDSRVVKFNMDIVEKPVPLKAFNGNFSFIDVAGVPQYFLLQPEFIREPYRLLRSDDTEPVMHDNFRLLGSREGVRIGVQCGGTTFFHPDLSSRLLRFEGVHLACYTLTTESSNASDASVLRWEWRTRLVPPVPLAQAGEYVRSRMPWRNCPSHPPSPLNDDSRFTDGSATVRQMRYFHEGILSLLLYYHAEAQLGASSINGLSDWLPILLFLDAKCGRIIRVTAVDNNFDMEFADLAEESVFVSRDQLFTIGEAVRNVECRRVIMHRLVNVEERNVATERWTGSSKYKSSVLNRKQRRQARKRGIGEVGSSSRDTL